MTFASFVQPNGTPISITTEYVCAIRGLSPDTAAQVWSITDSSPGASRGYVTVAGSFAAVTAAFGVVPFVLLTEQSGASLAINAAFSTRVEALPGDTACRVTWAADQQGGYAIVQGTYAATTAALTYTPTPGGAVPGGPVDAVQRNAGGGLFGGSGDFSWDLSTVRVENASVVGVNLAGVNVVSGTGSVYVNAANGNAELRSGAGTAKLYGAAWIELESRDGVRLRDTGGGPPFTPPTLRSEDAASALAPLDLQVAELQLAGNPGAPGEVLTSQGAGVPPSWAQPAPAPAALSFALNTSHNNVTPVDAGAFYVPGVFTPSGTVAVFVDSTAANVATVRVVDSFGAPVWTFTDPFPSTGYRVIPPTASPPLAAGWYRIDVACAGAGNVIVLGFFAA